MNEENEYHNNPGNWKLGIFYFNPKDKRVFVLKRLPGMGLTINFANPYSILVILGLIALILFTSHR
jgi:uncharacterized membrane protein